MLGSQGLLMGWVPIIFFLAVLIDMTSYLQEVLMVDSATHCELFFSILHSVGSVLTSFIGSALLI
jgi:hypothetical protein